MSRRLSSTGSTSPDTSIFTEAELAYLRSEPRLARLATVGPDGTPHVTPVGWSLSQDASYIEVSGRNFAATKKYRDAARTGRAALVVDDVLPPWQPRGVEVRGRAKVVEAPSPAIRIHPERIVSWGLDEATQRSHSARTTRARREIKPQTP